MIGLSANIWSASSWSRFRVTTDGSAVAVDPAVMALSVPSRLPIPEQGNQDGQHHRSSNSERR